MLGDTIVSGMWGNDTQYVGNSGVLGEKGVVVRVRSKWMLCIFRHEGVWMSPCGTDYRGHCVLCL